MDVLHFLSIAYKAYDGSKLNSMVYDGVSLTEKFNGIIIESYYGIFCSKIVTRFGVIRISGSGCSLYDPPIEAYIKSRITYKKLFDMVYKDEIGCVGPFYIVTHIDGIPITNDDVEGITYNNYYKYVTNMRAKEKDVDDYDGYIESCTRQGFIKDSAGIIDRLLDDPDYYPDAVAELIKEIEYPQYRGRLSKNMFSHIFSLLNEKRMLLF